MVGDLYDLCLLSPLMKNSQVQCVFHPYFYSQHHVQSVHMAGEQKLLWNSQKFTLT